MYAQGKDKTPLQGTEMLGSGQNVTSCLGQYNNKTLNIMGLLCEVDSLPKR